MKYRYLLTLVAVFPLLAFSGCQSPVQTTEAISVAELMNAPVYDESVSVYGEVSLLGQLNCPCFELESGGETVKVWYDLMVEDVQAERLPVSIEGIQNGDRVVVTGELKTEGQYRQLNDFWASDIEETG
ncbi:MAG: hypothetical protein R6T78_03325 [Dehalococcoidales bacterium]